MLYRVNVSYQDFAHVPPIDLRAGEVVELDDATANHCNRAKHLCVELYHGERVLNTPPHDRMERIAETRGENIGVMKPGDTVFRATKGGKRG